MTEETQTELLSQADKGDKKPKKQAKKQQGPTLEQFEKLQADFNNLVKCFEKVSTDTGQGNTIVKFGFKRVEPTEREMRRYE